MCNAANIKAPDIQIPQFSFSAQGLECKKLSVSSPRNVAAERHAGGVAGRADAAADWFGALGYELPRGVNQADYFLDLASGDISTQKIKVSLNKARNRKNRLKAPLIQIERASPPKRSR